jgi:ABC-2 type transport system ATP-binding protein
MSMVLTTRLRREYDDVVALHALDLAVPAGEVYGIIGPNGSGKSTLLRILATLVEPTYGTARIDGIDVQEDPKAVHRKVGFMPDFYQLYDDMTVHEFFEYFALAYHLEEPHRGRRIKEVTGWMNLTNKADAKIGGLSRGMKQRVCLGRALLHDPSVLLLDEPASGLDPMARIDLRNLIRMLSSQGKTILISSHILSELTDFCTWVGIMERGQLLESGPIEEIARKLKGGTRIRVNALNDLPRVLDIVSAAAGVSAVEMDAESVSFEYGGSREGLAELHSQLVSAGIKVYSFAVEKRDLEYIFRRIASHETS